MDHNYLWAFNVSEDTVTDAGPGLWTFAPGLTMASCLRSSPQRKLPHTFLSTSTLSDPGRRPSVVYVILEYFL